MISRSKAAAPSTAQAICGCSAATPGYEAASPSQGTPIGCLSSGASPPDPPPLPTHHMQQR
eukprot:12930012-Prorocentrum_lima.AAC.1